MIKFILFMVVIALTLYGSVARIERLKRIAQGKEKVYIPNKR